MYVQVFTTIFMFHYRHAWWLHVLCIYNCDCIHEFTVWMYKFIYMYLYGFMYVLSLYDCVLYINLCRNMYLWWNIYTYYISIHQCHSNTCMIKKSYINACIHTIIRLYVCIIICMCVCLIVSMNTCMNYVYLFNSMLLRMYAWPFIWMTIYDCMDGWMACMDV